MPIFHRLLIENVPLTVSVLTDLGMNVCTVFPVISTLVESKNIENKNVENKMSKGKMPKIRNPCKFEMEDFFKVLMNSI